MAPNLVVVGGFWTSLVLKERDVEWKTLSASESLIAMKENNIIINHLWIMERDNEYKILNYSHIFSWARNEGRDKQWIQSLRNFPLTYSVWCEQQHLDIWDAPGDIMQEMQMFNGFLSTVAYLHCDVPRDISSYWQICAINNIWVTAGGKLALDN